MKKDISVTYAREHGERRRIKCNYKRPKPFNEEISFYNPWHIALNHVKHVGRIYRKANLDKELWQDTRFQ